MNIFLCYPRSKLNFLFGKQSYSTAYKTEGWIWFVVRFYATPIPIVTSTLLYGLLTSICEAQKQHVKKS